MMCVPIPRIELIRMLEFTVCKNVNLIRIKTKLIQITITKLYQDMLDHQDWVQIHKQMQVYELLSQAK
jgi:hypothetical protein